jgi:two-component system response regulator MprA
VSDAISRLLIVDDDPELLRFLLDELGEAGHHCSGCDNGQDALLRLRQESFDLVVMDWTLPDFSGVELCRRLRASNNTTPVLMLTARDNVDERVKALDAGVDDYLTKPFNLKELHARVRARLRRGGYEQDARGEASGIELGDLLLDPIERRVQRGERSIALSQREFELLLFLVKNADEVQSRQTILDAVWGAPFVGDPNTLDVYMGYLRKKVEAKGEPQLLHTVRGVGFMARVGEPKS